MEFVQGDEILSEAEAEQDVDVSIDEKAKLVPVVESIRYRKRAQSAERKAEILAEKLEQANKKVSEISDEIQELRIERQLIQKLVNAGAVDLESAVIVARAKVKDESSETLDSCIDKLRKEKSFLFEPSNTVKSFQKTAILRDRATQRSVALERAANKATNSGNSVDLQEYLRLRRELS
jgi:hypothetical protein